MKFVTRVLVPLFLLLSPALGHAEKKPELGKYATVYSSSDGHTVTMLRLGKDDSTMLIKVEGIDNDFDGKIFKHTKICENTNCTTYKYETKEIPGKERWWTVRSSDLYGGYEDMTLYPPGINKKSSLGRAARPDSFDAEKFYQQYLGERALAK